MSREPLVRRRGRWRFENRTMRRGGGTVRRGGGTVRSGRTVGRRNVCVVLVRVESRKRNRQGRRTL